MGNKQTVFTHEQLEAYQVGVMDQAIGGFGSLVVFLAEEMGTASRVYSEAWNRNHKVCASST